MDLVKVSDNEAWTNIRVVVFNRVVNNRRCEALNVCVIITDLESITGDRCLSVCDEQSLTGKNIISKLNSSVARQKIGELARGIMEFPFENNLRDSNVGSALSGCQIRHANPERTPNQIIKSNNILFIGSSVLTLGVLSVSNTLASILLVFPVEPVGQKLGSIPLNLTTGTNNGSGGEWLIPNLVHTSWRWSIRYGIKSPPEGATDGIFIGDETGHQLDLSQIANPILPV